MTLTKIYAGELRDELRAAVDCRKVAEAWAALHPAGFQDVHGASKALPPEMSAFLGRFRAAISSALRKVLGKLWPEAYVLGQQAAKAATGQATAGWIAADMPAVDWAGWTPGDVEAARQVAGTGLRDLLADQDVVIKSIAGSRLEELGDVLARYISSDAVGRVPVSEGPLLPEYSVGALADALEEVLDDPSRAVMVAQTEIARASSIAAQETYRSMGVTEVEVSTAADVRVCPACEDAEAAGPQPLGTYTVPLHPLCRCALIPVLDALPEPTAPEAAPPGTMAVSDVGQLQSGNEQGMTVEDEFEAKAGRGEYSENDYARAGQYGQTPVEYQAEITESVREKGILTPLQVSHGVLDEGFHRYAAARQLGHDRVPVKRGPES